MADLDADWKKFLDATLEDDEEVETPVEDEPEIDDADEEIEQDDDQEEDAEDDEDEEDSEEDDPKKSKTGKKKPVAFKPRLKQFINDDGTLKAQELETAYIESSKNGVKLSKDLKTATESLTKVNGDYSALLSAIKGKPEIAEALFGKEGAKQLANSNVQPAKPDGETDDPDLRDLKARRRNESQKQYDDFVEKHPEAVTDPERSRLIGEFLDTFGPVYRKNHGGETATMKEGLEQAYKFYGWETKDDKKDKIANAAKKKAATKTTPRARRPATKKEASMSEQFFAAKLGVKLKSK